ncbi:hypothetical protein PLESTF_001102100 [Pleodorina starrii]|nr:hypothetical protein PLESTM_001650600 [Pleodorina starrii]GLC71315.1 hypothetical protein PLESTF_001102100 [Pleodorina starrii]
MAYGLNPADARREQQKAMRAAKARNQPEEDVLMVDLEDDVDADDDADDLGAERDDDHEQAADDGPQPDPVDYDLLMSVSHGLGKWMQDTTTGQKVYVKDQDCIGCLKDLQRFLRRDDPDIRSVFTKLGEWRIAAGDLLPLLITYPHDKDITLQAVKVLTYLTMPVDPSTAKPEIQEGYVRDVKEAMTQPDALVAVLGLVAEPLAAHPRMSPEQQGAVQLVLALLRNLLAVPDEKPSLTLAAGSSRTRLQASLLSVLFSESIMELLLLVAQHGTQAPLRREMPTLLEILCDTYRDITPQQLMAAKKPPPPQQQQPRNQQPPAPSAPAAAAAPPPPPAAASGRPSPAAFHPTGSAAAGGGRGGAAAGRPAAAAAGRGGGGAAAAAAAASGGGGGGPPVAPKPPSLDSAVAAQLRRQQLANAAKLRGLPGGRGAAVAAARPGGTVGRFVIAHADDPGQRRTFLVRPAAGATAATSVKQHFVEAPPKLSGPKPPGSSARRDAALMWRLRCFADELLESGYNQVMEVIRRDVSAGVGVGRLERPDLLRFVRLGAFFTQYCRLQQEAQAATKQQQQQHKAGADTAASKPAATAASAAAPGGDDPAAAAAPSPSPFSGISGTMGWDTFHLICKLWVEQADVSPKHRDWELQAATTRLLCEMLAVLVVAHRHGSREDRQAADRLQRRLLHDDLAESGLLPVLSRLMSSFSPARQSRTYACDLTMSLHYVLRMYDRLTAQEPGGFMVRAKKRSGGGRRKKQQQQQREGGEDGEGEGEKEKEEEEEEGEGGEGSQEGGGGGSGGGGGGGGRKSGKAPLEELAEGSGEEDDEEEDEDDDEAGGGGGGGRRGVVERPLDLSTKVRGKLAQPAVIYFAVQLLACYKSLAPEVPRAIASLLYRIAAKEHLGMEPLLYQISVLRVFYVLLSDPDLRSPSQLPAYREVLLLATRVVRGLFRKLVPERYPTTADKEGGKEEGDKGKEGQEGQEGEGEGQAAATAEEEARRRQRREELVGEIHDKAPRMLMVDMLFWKDHGAAAAINQDYWLWMALEDREREEEEEERNGGGSGGGGGAAAAKRRRNRDAWGDDEGEADRDGADKADGDGDGDGDGDVAPRTVGRLRRAGSVWGDEEDGGGGGGGGGGDDDGGLADEDGGGGGPPGTAARRRRAAMGMEDDEEEEGGRGGGAAATGGGRSQGGGRGAVLWSDDEAEGEREGGPRAARGAAAGGAAAEGSAGGGGGGGGGGGATKKPMTLQEREEMLRKRFLKTVRVGNGRSKRSGNAAGGGGGGGGAGAEDGGGGGGGRSLRLSPAQQALLVELFERHNASRHNADMILEGMKRGGRGGEGEEGLAATGEAAGAAGVEMSSGQLMRQIKKMGLRFKQLTEKQASRLTSLYGRYRDDPDLLLMIAAQLPGGWTSKDVKRLLVKHGLTAKGGRRGRRGSDSGGSDSEEDGEGEGSGGSGDEGDDDDPDTALLDEEELAVLWEEHGAAGQEDAVEKIAAALVTPASPRAVARKLRQMGLLKGARDREHRNKKHRDKKGGAAKRAAGGGGRGGRGGGEGGQVDVGALRRLWEEHRSRADHLNVIAALLPGGKTVKQIQRLLRSHGMLDDDAARRKRVRDAAERTRLVALYQQTRGSDDQLAAIARLMPELAGGARQVAKLLRKHGLTEGGGGGGGAGRRRRRSSDGGGGGGEGEGEEEGGGAARKGRSRGEGEGDGAGEDAGGPSGSSHARVREPDPERILQALAGIQEAYDKDRRWMDGRCAVSWVVRQLGAAESLWDLAGGASSDYCLVLTCEEDEDYFMTEYSQDLLEACGIRNTADDYYKIPAASSPAWRQRVRDALQAALGGLGGERAAELAAALRRRRAEEEAAAAREREARDAAEAAAAAATALFTSAAAGSGKAAEEEEGGRGRGRGGGRGRGRGGAAAAAAAAGRRRSAGGKGRKAKEEEEEEEVAESSDGGSEGPGAAKQQQQQRGRGPRGGEASESSGSDGSSSSSDGGSEGGSDGGDSDGAEEAGAGGGGDEAVVMPDYGSSSGSSGSEDDGAGGGRRKGGKAEDARAAPGPRTGAKAKAGAGAAARRRVPDALGGSSGSDGEGGGRPVGRRGAAVAVKRKAGKTAARKGGKEGRRGAATAAAAADAAAADGSGDDGGGGDGSGGRDAGADADARRRALAEIARRRQEQALRMQQRVKGTLVPSAAPSAEELREGDGDDGGDDDDRAVVVVAGATSAAGGGGEGPSAGSRRRRSGEPLGATRAGAAATTNRGAAGDEEEEAEDSDGGGGRAGGGGGKRRRLLRKAAPTGLGSGKENAGAGAAGGAKGGVAAGGVGGGEEEMVELEDGLEDF